MTLTELAEAKPGDPLGSIRHGGGQLIDTPVAKGILPEPHGDLEVLVALDNMGRPEAAVGIENIQDGQGDLGIEIQEGGTTDPIFMQRLVVQAMEQSGVKCAVLDPEATTVPKEILPKAGFHADASGESFTFLRAA